MKQYNPKAPDWVAPEVHEFLPQTYNTLATVSHDLFSYEVSLSPQSAQTAGVAKPLYTPGVTLEDPFVFPHLFEMP